MRLKEVLMLAQNCATKSNGSLVIWFSHHDALRKFMSALAEDIGCYASDLVNGQRNMFYGIEFRVRETKSMKREQSDGASPVERIEDRMYGF